MDLEKMSVPEEKVRFKQDPDFDKIPDCNKRASLFFVTKLLALNPDPTVTFCPQLLTPLSLPHDAFQ
jgi:hypothetical protein